MKSYKKLKSTSFRFISKVTGLLERTHNDLCKQSTGVSSHAVPFLLRSASPYQKVREKNDVTQHQMKLTSNISKKTFFFSLTFVRISSCFSTFKTKLNLRVSDFKAINPASQIHK